MRPPTFFAIVTLAVSALSMPLLANAQQTAPANNNAPPPPRLEKLDEGQAPAVTIRDPKGQTGTTEKRAPDGTVTEVKVRTGKSTYVVKPNQRLGSALPGDAQSPVTRPAQFQVIEFDQKPVKKSADPVPTLPPAPASPTSK